MYYRMEMEKEGLVVIERPLFKSKRIRFDEISSLEIYCKSIVPPLVSATFILIAQGILLTVTKAVNGNVLYVQVSITERNGYPFSGEVVAYVTENKINVNGTEWNSAYRGRAISQGVYLRPNSYSALYGNWSIPSDSRSNMLEVIAVAYDRNSQGKYGPYAVQSASEKDRNLAIPEFGGWLLLLTFSTLFITASILRGSFKRGYVA